MVLISSLYVEFLILLDIVRACVYGVHQIREIG